jgi:hypothetical protein
MPLPHVHDERGIVSLDESVKIGPSGTFPKDIYGHVFLGVTTAVATLILEPLIENILGPTRNPALRAPRRELPMWQVEDMKHCKAGMYRGKMPPMHPPDHSPDYEICLRDRFRIPILHKRAPSLEDYDEM